MTANKKDMPKDKPYISKDGEVRELDDYFFEHAVPGKDFFETLKKPMPGRGRPPLSENERKKRVTIMLDKDVIAHFKKDGKGWQTRANAALRKAAGLS